MKQVNNTRISHRLAEVTGFRFLYNIDTTYYVDVDWNPMGSTVLQYGFCVSETNPMPDLTDGIRNPTTGPLPYSNQSSGTASIGSLYSGHYYYVRAFIKNIAGYAWSEVIVINADVPANIPSVITTEAYEIYSTHAKAGGTVLNDGGATVTERGVCWNTAGSPTYLDSHSSDGTGLGVFTSTATPLSESTSYKLRAYAKNSAGIGYGNQVEFTTTALMPPIMNIYNVTDITTSSLIAYGNVLSDSGFTILQKGFVWNISGNPDETDNFTSSSGSDEDFNALITGLPSGVSIYIKAAGQNSVGWGFSSQAEIIMPSSVFPIKYGYLYNWFAATDVRNITSSDEWIVPTQEQVQELVTFLGGDSLAGGKLKETGTIYWNAPNEGALNSVGFNGRGSGRRMTIDYSGYEFLKEVAYFLTSTEYESEPLFCIFFNLNYSNSVFGENPYFKQIGNSIRLCNPSTSLSNGQSGTYSGNDGKIYRTICIGSQEWLADNLAETKYRNGDLITTVTDSTAWSTLTIGAKCSYNNDDNNV